MTNQGDLQGNIRSITGSANDYNGDWHALFDLYGIAEGEFNGRLIVWLQTVLGSTATNINDLKQEYADLLGVYNWNSVTNVGVPFVSNGELSSLSNFTRASLGTYFDVNGVLQTAAINEARKNYLQDGSGNYGLLIEGARTNLARRSEELGDNSVWNAGTNATVADNVAIAPDGNTTGDRLTADSSITGQRREQTISVSASTTKYGSIWIKAGTQNTGQARLILQGSAMHQLDITPTSDWVRYELEVPSSDTGTSIIFRVYPSSTGGALGDNILVWGAQFEQAPFTSSYIKTTTASVTRAADVATIDVSAASWLSASEGTIYCDFNRDVSEAGYIIHLLNDTSNFIAIYAESPNLVGRQRIAGTITDIGSGGYPAGQVKAAYAYKVNDHAFSYSGNTPSTNGALGVASGITSIELGNRSGGGGQLFGLLTNVQYYNTRLSDSNLQVLTA